MNTPAPESFSTRRGRVSLWTGVLAGPVLWFASQQAHLLLVPWVCRTERVWVLHLVTFVCLGAVLAAGSLACAFWRQSRVEAIGEGGTVYGRVRFMALVGMGASALFALVILAQGLPNFFIDPCHR